MESFSYLGLPFTVGGLNQNLFYEGARRKAEVGALRLSKLGVMYHIPIPMKVRIFKQFRRPRLEYGLGLMTRQLTQSRALDGFVHRVLSWVVGTSFSVSKLGLAVTLGVESVETRRKQLSLGIRSRLERGDGEVPNPTKGIYRHLAGKWREGKLRITGRSPRLLNIAAEGEESAAVTVEEWAKAGFVRMAGPTKRRMSRLWLPQHRYLQLYVLSRLPGALDTCRLCGGTTRSYTDHARGCVEVDAGLKQRVQDLCCLLRTTDLEGIGLGTLGEAEELLRCLRATIGTPMRVDAHRLGLAG